MSGSATATSRYVKLKQSLDEDIFNGKWHQVDIRTINSPKPLTFVDLFSGAGELSLGFVQAGFRKLASVEINEFASRTVRRNFPESVHFDRPIEEISKEEFLDAIGNKSVDAVIGGPPCNGFSVAGARRIDDPRNKLFLDFVRVVSWLKPKFVVMENVPGILTIEKGAVRQAILERLEDLGYFDTAVRILEAAEFGVPQLRTRAIFIGNRLGRSNPYPKPQFERKNYRSIESAISDLMDEPRNATNNHEWTAHSKKFERRIANVPPGGSLYETYRDAFKRQHRGVPSMAIKENHGGVHIHYELNRVLSAREMARLQTFPDDFFFEGGMKKAYWQIGNAVPCVLARSIALAIQNDLAANSFD